MRKLKLVKAITLLLVVALSFVQCNQNEEIINNEKEYLHTSGEIKYIKKNTVKKSEDEKERFSIEFKLYSNIFIPKFDKEEELRLFLQKNREKISGSFVLEVNGIEVYESKIKEGVEISKVNSRWNVKNYNRAMDYECNFDSLSKCTQDSIDDMSFLGKASCIIEGFACVAFEFADCAWKNCGGEEFVQENTNL